MNTIFSQLIEVVKEVIQSALPLLIIFLIFQAVRLKLPKSQFIIIMRGFVLTFLGLGLFLLGINIGFVKAGELIGKGLGGLEYNWVLIPVGFLLGLLVTLAEPAVKILNIEVEKVSAGYINRTILLYFLSFGVAIAIALSMIRMLKGISLWYFLLPGYIAILILMWFVKPIFVAVAFDAGGAVTSPMVVTFLMALTVGSSKAIVHSNPLLDAFGMIAMVAVVPVFSILFLGVLYQRKEANNKGVIGKREKEEQERKSRFLEKV
jgi:MFS family permease